MFAKLVAVSLLTLASSQLMAAECKVDVDSTDQMSYSTKEITIDKSCKTFTVNLTHSGSLPKSSTTLMLVRRGALTMSSGAFRPLLICSQITRIPGVSPVSAISVALWCGHIPM